MPTTAAFGVTMVKDEADVIAGTLVHMADELDHLLIADNGSTDGTREILAELEDRFPITVVDDPDPAYHQSAKMSALAAQAAAAGAEWVVPFDADELWLHPDDRLRFVLTALPGHHRIALANLYNHFPTAVDPDDPDPFRSIVWRQPAPAPLPKVAFRWEPGAVIHQGNHGVSLPSNPASCNGLEIRHFPYRSAEQFVRKARNGAAAYAAATDLPATAGAHWRSYGEILDRHGEQVLIDEVFKRWFWSVSPVDMGWVLDPAPYARWPHE